MASLNLIAKLGYDGKAFHSGLNAADSHAKKFSKDFKSQLAGAFTFGAAAVQIRNTIEYASKVNDYAAAIGVSTDRLQEMNYAATLNGATLDDMARAMKNVAEARREALQNPAGEKAQSFRQFGIDSDILRSTKDPSDLFYRLSDAVQGVNMDMDSTPLLLELIGSKGAIVIPAMKEGFAEAGKALRDMNGLLENETIQALDKVGDQIDKTMLGLKRPVAEFVLFWLRALDVIQTGIQLAFNKAVSTSELIAYNITRRIPGYGDVAQRHKVSFEASESEIERIKNEFLDRYDPAKKAKTKGISGLDDGFDSPAAKNREGIRAAERLRDLKKENADLTEQIAMKEMTSGERLNYLMQKRLLITNAIKQAQIQAIFSDMRIPIEELKNINLKNELDISSAENAIKNKPASDSLAQIGGRLGGTDYSGGFRSVAQSIREQTKHLSSMDRNGVKIREESR